MKKMLTYVRPLAVFLLFDFAAPAQSPQPNWAAVQGLPVGTEVRVALNVGRVQGWFQSANENALMIHADTGDRVVMRPEIVRVSIRRKGHRARNALIGLAAGAGVGAAIGAVAINRCTGFCIITKGQGAGVGAALFAVVGTLIGVVIPTGGWHEVYRR